MNARRRRGGALAFAALMLVANVAAWAYFRRTYLVHFGPLALWLAQMSFAQALFLFDILIVVAAWAAAALRQARTLRDELAGAHLKLLNRQLKTIDDHVAMRMDTRPVAVNDW
jgi:hypothetical protein